MFSVWKKEQAPENEKTVTYDRLNESPQSPNTNDSSSQSDALLKKLKGKKSKWNHENPSYSQKVPQQLPELDPKLIAKIEEHSSQNSFTPLTIDDKAVQRFDSYLLKDFYFRTNYRPNIQKAVVQRNIEMLKENENRVFKVFLPPCEGQRERWDAIDFHVRYNMFRTYGRVTDPVFEEKFTEEELQENGITGDLLP